MDWDWVPLGIALAIVGGFYLWSLHLAFEKGVQIGQQVAKPLTLPRATIQPAQAIGKPSNQPAPCSVCGLVQHHPNCPENKPKPPAARRQSFSASKRVLESQETSNAS